jgi:hydrogenase nickel incorporation protein HypA/HybF
MVGTGVRALDKKRFGNSLSNFINHGQKAIILKNWRQLLFKWNVCAIILMNLHEKASCLYSLYTFKNITMHELTIAQNILEIVQQSVPEEKAQWVRWIRMRVGPLSGIVADSLEFCFEAITNGTNMRNARLAIEHAPMTFRCKNCRNEFQTDDLAFLCPACQSSDLELISGKELEILEIELIDESDEAL